jgi:hypothetical protein
MMAHLDERTRYTITIEGSVDPALADWCGPLSMESREMPDGTRVTVLSGINSDQSGLVGILRHLHGLGIVLLYVERCTAPLPAA